MTEQFSSVPPAGDHAGEGRRGGLRRPVSGRYVGGVAAGLARWFAIDPLLVRVAFIVLTLFGGSGVLVYVVAWLVIPEDGATEPLARAWLQQRGPINVGRVLSYLALAVVGLVVLSIAFAAFASHYYWAGNSPLRLIAWLFRHGLQLGLLVAVTLVAVSVLSRGRSETTATPSVDAVGVPGSVSRSGSGMGSGDAALVDRLRSTGLVRGIRRRRSPLGWLTLGVTLALVAVLSGLKSAGHLSLSGLRIGAIALLVLAIGLLIGAFAGWSRWLVAIAMLLSIGLVPTTVSRQAAIGTWRETVLVSADQWALGGSADFQRIRGTEILDLSTLVHPHIPHVQPALDANGQPVIDANGALVPGQTVTTYMNSGFVYLSMTAGKAVIIVPRTGHWALFAQTRVGTVLLPDGQRASGISVDRSVDSITGSSEPYAMRATSSASANSDEVIHIQVQMAFGDIEVRNATS
jgi:phage shock protein PspC (stress-responsive transcriptional regulator)